MGGSGGFRADGVADLGGLVVVAVFRGGLGGPEEGVDAADDGFLGRFGEGDGVDGGVEGGFGIRVAERTALPVRILESFLSAQDFEHDAAGGMETAGWQPSWRAGGGD